MFSKGDIVAIGETGIRDVVSKVTDQYVVVQGVRYGLVNGVASRKSRGQVNVLRFISTSIWSPI